MMAAGLVWMARGRPPADRLHKDYRLLLAVGIALFVAGLIPAITWQTWPAVPGERAELDRHFKYGRPCPPPVATPRAVRAGFLYVDVDHHRSVGVDGPGRNGSSGVTGRGL